MMANTCPMRDLSPEKLDPFESTVEPLDEYKHAVLNYGGFSAGTSSNLRGLANAVAVFDLVMPRLFSFRSVAQVSKQYSLAYATDNGAVLYSLLCVGSRGIAAQSSDPRHSHAYLAYKGEAMGHLQRSISGSKDTDVGIAISYAVAVLLHLEVSRGLAMAMLRADRAESSAH